MMRMKHLLKKLHIGGGGGGQLVDLQVPTPSSSSPSVAVDSVSASAGRVGDERDSASFGGIDGTPEDFSFFEEEYQVQMALAISVSDPDGRDDPESAQINAAKRISLGCTPVAGGESLVEIVSQRYWNFNMLNYDEKVMDGFYDVYGIVNSSTRGKMPLLVDAQSASIADIIEYEVVLVNRTIDVALQQLERRAVSISSKYRGMKLDSPDSGLIQNIADLVAGSMGGPVRDSDDIIKKWVSKSDELRTSLNTIVIPIGCIEVGLSRHRALLFKVLADHIDLPCKLVKGSYYTGADEGAVNLIKLDDEKEYIIDLMGAPGALIPAELPSCLLQNAEFDLVNSNRIAQTVRDLSLALGSNTNWQLDGRMKRTDSFLLDTYVGLESIFSVTEDDNRNSKKIYDTDRFNKHNSSMFLSSFKNTGVRNSGNNKPGTPLGQIKVDDVSKYVVGTANNPEFAQNLHADLLESDAPPSHDLLSCVNSLDGIGDKKDLGEQALKSDFPDNDSEMEQLQKTDIDQNIVAYHPDNAYRNNESLLHNFGATEMIQENINSFGAFARDVPNKTKVSDRVNIYQEVDSRKWDHRIPTFSPSQAVAGRITKVLDEVAECEIPWDDLAIGERIGIGSYGEVYRADWNGNEVAVKKFLDQDLCGDALEQFRDEIQIMLRLRHPNVILFMGAVTRPPNLSILTEFLPRGSLFRLLRQPNVHIEEKRRLKMALDVAKGMNYLHTSHPTIVHRDLKSTNLLVDENWVVKVCDFGLARLKHHTFLSSKSTAGTPEWMAPEVLRNERSNEKCDVYSFGVILWELATLSIPWSGMNPMQVVGAVGFQNRRLDLPNTLNPLVADIIWSCWHNDPDQRPSFSQLMSSLKTLKGFVD